MNTLLLEKIIEANFASNQSKPWSDPALTLATINQQLIRLPLVNINDSHIALASWNGEYLRQAKANHFMESYEQIVKRHHLLALQEVSPAGLSTIASACAYNHFVCHPNSRGQAVGFLLHPRFSIINVQEYNELANICGMHDLRPALQIDIHDQQTDISLSLINIHLKSMLGGLAFTSFIRKKQLEELAAILSQSQTPTIILGDFNCLLDTSTDTQPLSDIGFIIANRSDHASTQAHGGRLDGLFYKNLSDNLLPTHYNIRNFWRINQAGLSLSDHGLLTWKLANR